MCINKIELKHEDIFIYKDIIIKILDNLLLNYNSNNNKNLCKEINKQILKLNDNKIKGSVFEIFIEFICKYLYNKAPFGFNNYIPNNIIDDLGIDAYCVYKENYYAVQIKYRNLNDKNNILITYEEICKTYTQYLMSNIFKERFKNNNSIDVIYEPYILLITNHETDNKDSIITNNVKDIFKTLKVITLKDLLEKISDKNLFLLDMKNNII